MATKQQQSTGEQAIDTAKIRKLLDRFDSAATIAGDDTELIETIQTGVLARLGEELGVSSSDDTGDEDDDSANTPQRRRPTNEPNIPIAQQVERAIRAQRGRANAPSARISDEDLSKKRERGPYSM